MSIAFVAARPSEEEEEGEEEDEKKEREKERAKFTLLKIERRTTKGDKDDET